MLTSNFKAMMNVILQRCTVTKGLLPVKAYNGTTYYINTSSSHYIYSPSYAFTVSASSAGICVGTGDTAAAETDYMLESQITSGLAGSVVQSVDLDTNGNPYVTYDITITNSGSQAVTIKEIGYKQNLNAATTQGGNSTSNRVCLIDRTVLDDPVTIQAGEFGVVRYVLKTIVE